MKKYFLYNIIHLILIFFSVNLFAQQKLSVSLQLNYADSASLYQNEPVLLVVAVSNKVAQENSIWNDAADTRLDELEHLIKEEKISRENYDREKVELNNGKRKLEPITFGTVATPWNSLIVWKMINVKTGNEVTIPVRILKNPTTDTIAVIDEYAYYSAFFGIDAEALQQIPAAAYNISAQVAGRRSEAVYLEIKKEAMPASVAASEEMLLKLGQYYWHMDEADRTIEYAGKIIDKNPASIDGLSLKADGLVIKESYSEALEIYRKALKLYYDQNGNSAEPPEYLESMISILLEKIEGKNE